MANWHPLTWLSHMLDAEIFGNNPSGPHLVNLLFHTANVVLLFFLLYRLTAARSQSLVVALIFAVHPLHVESVAWIAERKDLLCAFFMLLALVFYARYVRAGNKWKAGERKVLRRLSGLLCARADEQTDDRDAAVSVAATGLVAFKPNQGFPSRAGEIFISQTAVDRKNPIFDFEPRGVGGHVSRPRQRSGPANARFISSFGPMENTFVSYVRYVGKVLWPMTLAIPYPYPDRWPVALVILSVLLFVGASVAALWLVRKWPPAFTGWFWFAGHVDSDHRSGAGRNPIHGGSLCLFADGWTVDYYCLGTGETGRVLQCHQSTGDHHSFAHPCRLFGEDQAQLAYWHNDGMLFGHALNVTTNNYVAHVNIGAWLSKNGRPKEALDHYDVALQIKPNDPTALYNTANILARLGRLDEAVTNYRRALQITPDNPDIMNNLGVALMELKQLPEATATFESVLKIKPDFADVHNNLATALFRQGRYEDAAKEFFAAVSFAPNNVLFLMNLGDAMLKLGRRDKAAECYQQALQLEPGNPSIMAKLKALDVSAAH